MHIRFVVQSRALKTTCSCHDPAYSPGARGFETFLKCFEAGVLVRSTADTIALSPPLIVEPDQIEQIIDTVRDAVRAVA